MMDLVRSTNSSSIPVVGIPEHLKPLMDKDIMDHKIGHPISEDTQADRQASPETIILPANETNNTNRCVENKEGVISFPPAAMIFFVMVLV